MQHTGTHMHNKVNNDTGHSLQVSSAVHQPEGPDLEGGRPEQDSVGFMREQTWNWTLKGGELDPNQGWTRKHSALWGQMISLSLDPMCSKVSPSHGVLGSRDWAPPLRLLSLSLWSLSLSLRGSSYLEPVGPDWTLYKVRPPHRAH